MSDLLNIVRVTKPEECVLDRLDPNGPPGISESDAKEKLKNLCEEMGELQELLSGSRKNGLLIVVQGQDASGKDGTIRRALQGFSPLFCRAIAFKKPSVQEFRHDFLARIHAHSPGLGEIALFNRSHYEDILVPSVHGTMSSELLDKRFEHIRAFENLLLDSGVIVLKFFLHISREEQESRLRARETNLDRAWKLDVEDWQERAHWQQYQETYQKILDRSSQPHAPWFVIPANRKWLRNVLVAQVVVDAMRQNRAVWRQELRHTAMQFQNQIQKLRTDH